MIAKASVELERSAFALPRWVDDVLARVDKDPSGVADFRTRRGLWKPFVEESMPIAELCRAYFRESREVFVAHVVGSQNFDATVRDVRAASTGVEYIEVTTAVDGYDAALRLELLNDEGAAPAIGPIGRDNTRNVVAPQGAAYADQMEANAYCLLEEAVKKKALLSYPCRTALVVSFDDSLAFRDHQSQLRLREFAAHHLVKPATAGDSHCWHLPDSPGGLKHSS